MRRGKYPSRSRVVRQVARAASFATQRSLLLRFGKDSTCRDKKGNVVYLSVVRRWYCSGIKCRLNFCNPRKVRLIDKSLYSHWLTNDVAGGATHGANEFGICLQYLTCSHSIIYMYVIWKAMCRQHSGRPAEISSRGMNQ